MGITTYARDGEIFTEIACPTRGICFGNFMRGSKLWMGVIKKHDLGVTSDMTKAFLEGWNTYWRKEVMMGRGKIY